MKTMIRFDSAVGQSPPGLADTILLFIFYLA